MNISCKDERVALAMEEIEKVFVAHGWQHEKEFIFSRRVDGFFFAQVSVRVMVLQMAARGLTEFSPNKIDKDKDIEFRITGWTRDVGFGLFSFSDCSLTRNFWSNPMIEKQIEERILDKKGELMLKTVKKTVISYDEIHSHLAKVDVMFDRLSRINATIEKLESNQ
jgi:hypothetical protein